MGAVLFDFFKNLASVLQPPVYSPDLPSARVVPFSNLHIWLNSPQVKIGINKINGQYIYIPPRGDRDYAAGDIIGESLFCLGDKPFGVEPGFLAVLFDANLLVHYKEYIAEQAGYTKKTIENLEELRKYFAEKDEEAKAAVHAFVLWLQKQYKAGAIKGKNDVMLLFKQDYDDPGFTRSTVRPRMVRLAQTNAVKGKYEEVDKASGKFSKWVYEIKKTFRLIGYTTYKEIVGDRSKENFNAVAECLGNDLTIANGVQCQQQSLVFTRYSDGFLKGMTCCEWEPELEIFQGRLRGDDGHHKYLVKVAERSDNKTPMQFAQDSKGRYYSDDSIIDLAFNLVFLIVGYDRDAIGSNGQNKGKVKGRYFGLDNGQLFRNLNNRIIQTLKDDFSFDPIAGNDFIKNLSIFYDSPLSERMAGMFFLYQTMDPKIIDKIFKTKEEQANVKKAIQAYSAQEGEIGTAFTERIEKIKEGADEQKIQDYIDTYTYLAKAAKKDGDMVAANVFNGYVEKLTRIKKYTIKAKKAMLKIFKERMQLKPAEVDLLDHLEKLTSPTSMLSNDGTVMLNYLRILPDKKLKWWEKLCGKKAKHNRVAWQMSKINDGIIITSDLMSKDKAEHVEKVLREYLKENKMFAGVVSVENGLAENSQQYQLKLKCSNENLEILFHLFAETKIMAYKAKPDDIFHPTDHFKISLQNQTPGGSSKKYRLNNMSAKNGNLKIFTTPKKQGPSSSEVNESPQSEVEPAENTKVSEPVNLTVQISQNLQVKDNYSAIYVQPAQSKKKTKCSLKEEFDKHAENQIENQYDMVSQI